MLELEESQELLNFNMKEGCTAYSGGSIWLGLQIASDHAAHALLIMNAFKAFKAFNAFNAFNAFKFLLNDLQAMVRARLHPAEILGNVQDPALGIWSIHDLAV